MLLARGADVNVQNKYDIPALGYALAHDHPDAARALLMYGATVPDDPDECAWFTAMLESRDVCRSAAVAWLGVYSKRSGTIMHQNNLMCKDISPVVGKIVFETRLHDEIWLRDVGESKARKV